MTDFEKLGAFYLGRGFDLATGKADASDLLLYDSRDLTTHAVILGMTGSGKTGLGVALLEEAAIDGVPAIVIDPKGDLGNLRLAFPDLAPSDFRPWIDEGEAARRGVTPDAFAAETALRWRTGLAEWGQDPSRIARFRDSVETTIYTPGSAAGAPLSILRSFSAPPPAVAHDAEAMRERVLTTASGLLAIVGIDADPVRSREHVLLSNLLDHAWRAGRDLDLPSLIREVQKPPFSSVGVLDLESFFPSRDRFALATALNALLASPGFSVWTEGAPLDVARLLFSPEGKPRLSILSLSHLGDAERMFVVTTLLNEVVAWMRAQSGTSSLRAILYMDEVFGYFPPTANPPSKLPMLTLLKQARAFGLGVVLATQNPVDLDYKGLGNAGTWFIGRLQTERDKARVLDGLEGAAAAEAVYDRARLDATLSALRPRVFLMCNAHDDAPVLFQSRFALSYLRGPLTRPQIQALSRKPTAESGAPAPTPIPVRVSRPAGAPAAAATSSRAVLPPEVVEMFAPVRSTTAAAGAAGRRLEYRPSILGTAKLHYVDARRGLDAWEAVAAWAPFPGEMALDPWEGATIVEGTMPELARAPVEGAAFAPLPPAGARAKTYAAFEKALEEWLYRTRSLSGFAYPALGAASRPGESEGDFRVRLAHALRERRDAEVEALRKKYRAKLTAADDKVRAAEARLEREKAQAAQARLSTGISVGAAFFGALFGGRRFGSASHMGTAARGMGRAAQQAQDVGRAEESLEVLVERRAALQREVEEEISRLRTAADLAGLFVEPVRVAPRKGDLSAGPVSLVWAPFWIAPDGSATPAS